jgi:hypothetical protein
MFQTDQAWETVGASNIVRALMRRPGLRQYPLVEISTDMPILHVDVKCKSETDGCEMTSRYLCMSAAVVLDIVRNDEVKDASVILQLRSEIGSDFRLERVSDIYYLGRESGEHELFLGCEGGNLYIDGTGEKAQVDLSRLERLWIAGKMSSTLKNIFSPY